MRLSQDYKKEAINILIGFSVLLFPFFETSYLLLAFLAGTLVVSRINPDSDIFKFLARDSETRSGKLTGLVQLFITTGILLLVSLILGEERFPLFIIGSALAITAFGQGATGIFSFIEHMYKPDTPESRHRLASAKSSIVFLTAGGSFAFLASAWIWMWGNTLSNESFGMLFFLAILGAITGALLGSIIISEENIILPFGSAMTMLLFYTFGFSYYVETWYLVKVLFLAFALGYLAYKVRIADISAMLSATLLGVVIIISSGLDWFFILLSFFLLGGVFTRYKYSYKLARGIAEGKGGVRGYKNVFSNSLAALSLSVAYGVFPSHGEILLAAFLGSVATAAGDTLASEIGETYRGEPRMITTFKKVPAGTDGGISILGEGASLFGSSVIALLAFMFIHNDINLVAAVVAGGFIGTNIDSVFGATFQQKGYLSNNGVNLFATISGALISGIIYYMLGS
ncbi:MAG: TIGR00297 family protein [Candidatus Methanoperedenaceae archaeon]|nr:TIGR00297 family protein [Candidatus Methanoperedenaceae archaeon]